MTTQQLRRAAELRLKTLPPDKLKVAAEFIGYLQHGASDEATAELLRIPGLIEDVRKAHREIAAGKGVEWRKVLFPKTRSRKANSRPRQSSGNSG